MEYSIQELSRLSGVTTRALRWYDQIGLLKPGRVAENGGRSIAVTASDPRGLTSEDLADIRRRVLDGEKIRF